MEKLLLHEKIRPIYNISDTGDIYYNDTGNKVNVVYNYMCKHSFISLVLSETHKNGHTKAIFRVDELVMNVFGSPKPSVNSYVIHKDGIPLNNNINNLEWCDDYLIRNGFSKLDYFENIYPDCYWINEKGHIHSVIYERDMTPRFDKDGYSTIDLKTIDSSRIFRLHNLVLKFYKGNPPENIEQPVVDHIDHDISNNNINNLRWLENNENISNRVYNGYNMSIIGKHHSVNGEDCPSSKLSIKDVKNIIRTRREKEYNTVQKVKDRLELDFVSKSAIERVLNHKWWTHVSIPYEFALDHNYTDFDDSPEFTYSEDERNEYCDTVEEMKEFSPFSETELIY